MGVALGMAGFPAERGDQLRMRRAVVSRGYFTREKQGDGYQAPFGPYLLWTTEGLDRIAALEEQAADIVGICDYIHTALPRWLYGFLPGQRAVDLAQFHDSDAAWHGGVAIDPAVVELATEHLVVEGLLTSHRREDRDTDLQLTHLGIRFVHSNQSLGRFMSRPQPQLGNEVTNYGVYVGGNATHSNLASGSHNSQTINQGIDGDALTSLVSQLRAAASALTLPAGDAEDLAEEISTLEHEGVDLKRGQRIWRSIVRILTPAVTSALTGEAEQAVHVAITAGTDLFS
ncbi:hypothetical protein [Streptomyces sp. NPDC046860]|uniref:hypothetical protein n=1 Tax=Streptomyces sp. NPDC046860 TaxID=3154495 RepID=UPI0033EC2E97